MLVWLFRQSIGFGSSSGHIRAHNLMEFRIWTLLWLAIIGVFEFYPKSEKKKVP